MSAIQSLQDSTPARRLARAIGDFSAVVGISEDGDEIDVDALSLIAEPVGWYLNHSDRPNVAADESGRFHSLRRIRKGEELTADYRTFTEERLPFRPKGPRPRRARSPSRGRPGS